MAVVCQSEGDLYPRRRRDRTVFEPLVLESDAVVHFGAAVSVGQSMYQVDRYVDVNTRGTALLLDILVNNKHHVEKVLVASSIGVYGEGAYRCATHGSVAPTIRPEEQLAARDWEQRCPTCHEHVVSIPTPEDKALYRDNIYSMTKLHQEEMVLLIGKTYGIPSVAPRFFNVYGPRQSLSNPYAGVAAIWLSRLLNDRQPVVFEDGGTAARLRLDPRRRRLPGADDRDAQAPTSCRSTSARVRR
jgi:dTDP-L-rhamnose 4-epimerase